MAANVIPLARNAPLPPCVPEAEQSLLATLLAKNTTIEQVADTLHPRHFYDPLHARMYAEIARRIVAGEDVSGPTMRGWITSDEAARDVGGYDYVLRITRAYARPEIRHLAKAIIDCWRRREIHKTTTELAARIYDGQTDIDGITTAAMSALQLALEDSVASTDMTFNEALDVTIKHATKMQAGGGMAGLRLDQFPQVMAKLSLLSEELTILAGQPGEGKSALAFQWAIDIARDIRDRVRNGESIADLGGVIIFSLEMGEKMVGARALAALTGIPSQAILSGTLSPTELETCRRARIDLADLPICLEAVGGLTPTRMRMKMRAKRRRFGGRLALVVIDHLQLTRPEDRDARSGGAWAMGAVADSVMDFKKEFKTHVLALSQLDIKDIAKRKDKHPSMADLRWSANFAQNADTILFIHRPELYLPKTPPSRETNEYDNDYDARIADWRAEKTKLAGVAELLCDKSRGGEPNWLIRLMFDGRTTTFSEDPSRNG